MSPDRNRRVTGSGVWMWLTSSVVSLLRLSALAPVTYTGSGYRNQVNQSHLAVRCRQWAKRECQTYTWNPCLFMMLLTSSDCSKTHLLYSSDHFFSTHTQSGPLHPKLTVAAYGLTTIGEWSLFYYGELTVTQMCFQVVKGIRHSKWFIAVQCSMKSHAFSL